MRRRAENPSCNLQWPQRSWRICSVERQDSRSLIEPLSDNELEILRLIARGTSNREIASGLFIAEGTVKEPRD